MFNAQRKWISRYQFSYCNASNTYYVPLKKSVGQNKQTKKSVGQTAKRQVTILVFEYCQTRRFFPPSFWELRGFTLPVPSLWVIPVHQPRASCILHRTWTGDSFHIWYYTCFNAILPNHPTLALSQSPKDCSTHLCLFMSSLLHCSFPLFTRRIWLGLGSLWANEAPSSQDAASRTQQGLRTQTKYELEDADSWN